MRLAIVVLGLCIPAAGMCAQPVYRCGNAYSNLPCANGRVVEATDPRSAAQRAEAARLSAEEKQRGDAMKRERIADERAAGPPPVAGRLSAAAALPAKHASDVERRPPPRKKRALQKPVASDRFSALDAAPAPKRSRR